MKSWKHLLPAASLVFLVAILAACGSTPPQPTVGGYITPTAAATTPATNPTSPVLSSATVTVKGQATKVLVDEKGKTLYWFSPDTATQSNCTGACAKTWPPTLFSGTDKPTATEDVMGTLEVVQTANGSQLSFNKHLLYTYIKDTAAGQANGEGVGGKWYVVPTTSADTVRKATVASATVTVKGQATKVLVDANGKTLYWFSPDTATQSNCTGACAKAWPPALFSGTDKPTADEGLTGTLEVVHTANGSQLSFNKHLLYTFAKDTAPGQANGEGVMGKWYVVHADKSSSYGY